MFKKTYNYFKTQSLIYKILLFIYTLALTKSIFITPFTFSKGFFGIAFGILLYIIVSILCIFALYLLSSVSWKYSKIIVKRKKILLYMIPPLALNIFLLITFFPGKMSWDSMYIWSTTLTGNYSNYHPITYTIFVNFLNNIVDSPWIVIMVQFIYASFVYAYASYVFEGMGLNKKLCWAIVIILTIYPVNFHQSVTMLKDVPYVISLILISVIIMKMLTENSFKLGKLLGLYIVSLIAMFSRHNGAIALPIVFIIFLIYLLAKKNKVAILKVAALFTAVVLSFILANKVIEHELDYDYYRASNITSVMMMPSAQCSYTIFKNIDTMSDEMLNQVNRFFYVDGIFGQSTTYPNWEFNNRPLISLNVDEVKYNRIEFIRLYLKMLQAYPKDMMLEYQQITGIIWAIPDYGYTVYHNVGIAEFNNNIDFEIAYRPQLPKLAEFLDKRMSVVFWLRPAIWLMLSIFLLFLSSKKQWLMRLCIISPMVANSFIFFLGTPAQNTRYFYCNFTIFIVFLVYSFMTNQNTIKPKIEQD